VVKQIRFSIAGMCRGKKNVEFSMAGMCCSLKRHIQHVWNLSRSKMSDPAWPQRVIVKNVRFSMAGICYGKKRQIQHGMNVLWSK
jgi:hypothetical protein